MAEQRKQLHRVTPNLVKAMPEMYEASKIGKELIDRILREHPFDEIAQTQARIINAALAKVEGKQ